MLKCICLIAVISLIAVLGCSRDAPAPTPLPTPAASSSGTPTAIGCSSEPKYPDDDPCGSFYGPYGWPECLDVVFDGVPDQVVGVQYALDDTHDHFDGLTRLVLSYDSTVNTFTGTVENTSEKMLTGVGVVVYLESRESQLGPAPLVDLASGQTIEVTLPVDSKLFTTWSADVNIGAVSIAPDDGFSGIQDGIRFTLDYDPTANAFTGLVENTTANTLAHVTVEVRLYGSDDRGAQVTLADLAPSQVSEVTLPVGSDPFTSWSGHLTIR